MDSRTLLLAATILSVIFYHQVEAEIESRRHTRDSDKDYNDRRGILEQLFKMMNSVKKTKKTGNNSEFYYNYVFPKEPAELKARGLKCVPGRTVIQITEKEPEPVREPNSEDEDDRRVLRELLRTHMNTGRKEEYCKVCVCSVEGKDEYCSGRPAMNVNECMRLTLILDEFKSNGAYEHTRGLPFRIRRDYIWHNDEIPYEPKAKCKRGSSYYTNNKSANDTDIDVSSDVESLLDYSNHDVCQYCVCAVHGEGVNCIDRSLWFCDYLRYLRRRDAARDMYTRLFQQDRPKYFRQISWRLRRTMDDAINDFEEVVGLNDKSKCIPYISEYTDCNDENACTGCNQCLCVGSGQWQCEVVKECIGGKNYRTLDQRSIDEALENIERGVEDELIKEQVNSNSPLVPAPRNKNDDALIGDDLFYKNQNIDIELLKLLKRKRRSLGTETNKTNENIKFYHTVDEINEDILKNDNTSGTIQAKKFENLPKASRRAGISENDSLIVELSEPKHYETHINDNKIDVTGHSEDKYLNQENEKIMALIANHTVKQKDKELSKLIVNELKNGSELIGDTKAPIMSNITFTSENDTLTAMAFIAGNLLNQLWDMEKDSSEEMKDTEDLKHEKIADLLDLFKEPLNIRQENFLKSALEHLSVAIDKDKVLKNVSLCEQIEESRRIIEDQKVSIEDVMTEAKTTQATTGVEVKKTTTPKNYAPSKAISKIADVLNLMEKFQKVHKTLNDLKQSDKGNIKPRISRKKYKTKTDLTIDETDSLNVFGNILEKITKLLLPHKKSKKVVKAIKNHNLYAKSNSVAQTLKDKFGIDIGNVTVTAKDKMILDYLNTVKSQPNCIFHNIQDETKSYPNVEGDILLNLSEFFKIKSFMDLMKLLDTDKEQTRSAEKVQTKILDTVTTPPTTTSEATLTTSHSNKLAETKERLKDHIKSIIEDLRELQLAKGFPLSNISIADTLPCIYNLLKGDKATQVKVNKKDISPKEKISSIFGSLKRDLLAVPITRRSNVITEPRPKSAVVWERMVKNFDVKGKQMTRRTMDSEEPKSYDEIKKMMKVLEMPSKTYKNQILVIGVKPADRLALLKTLREETRKYIEVLESIKQSFRSLKSMSVEKQNDLKDFVYNAAMNINLNSKVIKNLNKYEGDRNIRGDVEIITPKREKVKKEHSVKPQPLRSAEVPASKKSLKLTRDQIINQLIKNRMEVYIHIKEAKKIDLSNDINYAIAKKILHYLEMGNYNLARELYKFIINQKETRDTSNEYTTVSSTIKSSFGFPKEPLLQFEEPMSQNKWNINSRDSWLKQLANLKKM